jgi:hypothetical protein
MQKANGRVGGLYRRVPIMPEFMEMLRKWQAEDAAARGVDLDELSGPIIHYKGRPVKRLKMPWGQAHAASGSSGGSGLMFLGILLQRI